MRLYLPEVFAIGALCLFYSDRPLSGSAFLAMSIFFALGQLGLHSQAQKAQQERLEKIFDALQVIAMAASGILDGVVSVVASQHSNAQDDEDDISYN